MELDFNSFDILSDDEQQVIDEINNTEVCYPPNMTLSRLFSCQTTTSPYQIAIEESGMSITFDGLDKTSNRIARLLFKAGVKTNQLVAIISERSIDSVAGIFGILKAGGGYLPIDSNYPRKRIQYMLKDSACQVIVTESSKLSILLEYLPESVSTIICLDETDYKSENLVIYKKSNIDREDGDTWTCPAEENDLAYVIYTSGSTGEPKGVMITHKAVINTLFWLQDTFSLTRNDVVAQKTSISFTDSVWEIFWPMIFGAKLSIFDQNTVKDPQKLFLKLKEERVTITQFVPAQMSLFLDAVRTENLNDTHLELKWVFNGGEALPVNIVQDWYSTFKRAKIANIYGMTESAIYATCYIIEESPGDGVLSIPLGKPIANTHVYILDKQGQICPFDVKGEICIGGNGITTGYWNKAELTEKAFTKHPKTGERLYCTGDLGLLRSDGIIEYLGRKDDQVQIRGYRVELKEVERAISSFHLIKENVVIAVVDQFGMTNLFCYFTSLENELEINRIVSYIAELLPEYMIPAAFMQLNEMPLTHNGKIDRKKMPKVEGRANRRTEYVAPRNEREQALAKIWAEILNKPVEEIGIYDSFLDIGGNSVSIVRLHQKIKKSFGSEVTVAELFSYPTIAAYMNHFENYDNSNEELDQEIMSILDSIEGGTADFGKSLEALERLKGDK